MSTNISKQKRDVLGILLLFEVGRLSTKLNKRKILLK